MYDIMFFASLFAGWIVLNKWVLPWFGIPTCMSGACRIPHVEQDAPLNSTNQPIHITSPGRE